MKENLELLAGLSGLGQVELALLMLLILVPAFQRTVRVLREIVADEQTPLRKLVRYLIPLVALVFVTAIMLAVAVAVYGLLR